MRSRTYKHLYNSTRWRRSRVAFLNENPLCVLCGVLADVVDHIIPHRGDIDLFYDPENWQPMCKSCHDSLKAQIESRGYHIGGDASGFPSDPNHPFNRR